MVNLESGQQTMISRLDQLILNIGGHHRELEQRVARIERVVFPPPPPAKVDS